MYDMHIHSDFSIDTEIIMEDMVKKAVEKNAKTICFTDHVELGVGENNLDVVFRVEDYFRKLNQLKYTHAGKLEILSGAEIGLQIGDTDHYEDFVQSGPFDFILGSIHTVRHMDIASQLVLRYSVTECLTMYYEDMLSCIAAFSDFDALAHIDYIDRYLPRHEPFPDFSELQDWIDPILQFLIDNGKALEVNTAPLRRNFTDPHPKTEILSRYRELGGELLTMGSDAHRPDHILADFRATERLLKNLGFKYIFKYKERKKYPIHLL